MHSIAMFIFALTAGPFACAPHAAEPARPSVPTLAGTRRPFTPSRDGSPVMAGISYGPFRTGQRPGGPNPTREQIRQDLELLAPTWGMVRVYSSRQPTETILQVLRDHRIPIQVVVGAWIAAEDEEGSAAANVAEINTAVRLANDYPEQVVAISVGNESQVSWSAHRSDQDLLIGHIQTVRAAIRQPVTTADDYNFWNTPESHSVAKHIDFLMLHAYAMWNQRSLDDAVPWTARIVADIQAEHPAMPIVVGETGWATALNPDGRETEHITAPAGEAEQARFFATFREWADAAGQPYFFFEAFDEPWKGGTDPRDVEKHWGLYDVHRTPKPALQGARP